MVPATTMQPGARPSGAAMPREHRPQTACPAPPPRAAARAARRACRASRARSAPTGSKPSLSALLSSLTPSRPVSRAGDPVRLVQGVAAPRCRSCSTSSRARGEVAPCAPLSGGAARLDPPRQMAALASLYMPAGASGVPCSSASSSVPEVPSTARAWIRWPGGGGDRSRGSRSVDGRPPQLRVLPQPAGRPFAAAATGPTPAPPPRRARRSPRRARPRCRRRYRDGPRRCGA